jgi:hypothetical protein
MLPTWQDVEIQSEIRKTRLQEAAAMRMLKQLPGPSNTSLSIYASALVRLGSWMVNTGEQLRSRYGDVNHMDAQLRSAGQGC